MKTKQPDNTIAPLIILAVMALAAYLFGTPSITLGPGIKVTTPPFQKNLKAQASFTEGHYSIQPLAEFDCKAKIIGRKTYSDHWSDICPIDYSLGWQHLSDEAVISAISFSQRTRWTYFRYRQLPEGVSHSDVATQHSNMHMCPSSDEIRKQLLDAPVGSIIHFKGKLISIKNNNSSWRTKSSLSRSDSRGGACEIVWVESFSIVN